MWIGVTASGEVVYSDEGEPIELRDDGTWAKVLEDRFATDAQGRRIRLRADGTWNFVTVADKPSAASTAKTASATHLPEILDEPQIQLQQVEILRRNVKRAKADHAEFRLRFTLELVNQTANPLLIQTDLAQQLQVESNRGAQFPVLAVLGTPTAVAPGEKVKLEVWAQGAPRWFGTKQLNLLLPAQSLGNTVDRVLRKNMTDVKRREVQSFEVLDD